MKPAPVICNDTQRLEAVHGLGILDTLQEERFDRITRLARQLFGVPIALVSLVDSDRQWLNSRQGLSAPQTPRVASFCGHAIEYEDASLLFAPFAQLDTVSNGQEAMTSSDAHL